MYVLFILYVIINSLVGSFCIVEEENKEYEGQVSGSNKFELISYSVETKSGKDGEKLGDEFVNCDMLSESEPTPFYDIKGRIRKKINHYNLDINRYQNQ